MLDVSSPTKVRGGGTVGLRVVPGESVYQVACRAAELLGYAPGHLYTLAIDGEVMRYQDDCPLHGEATLVDTGGEV